MKWSRPKPESPPFAVRRCWWCWAEVIECPTRCRFHGWKHMDTGMHRCWPGEIWHWRALFAWRGPERKPA